jgi:hypothetical protein
MVVAWHALVGWWLLHALPRASPRDGNRDALQVVYVSLPPLPAAAARMRAGPASRRDRHADRLRAGRRRPAVATTAVMVATKPDTTARPDLLGQARALVRGQVAPGAAVRDRFADRPARLPQADAGRFRMRDPVTPASALAWLGRNVIAPAGYEADPCPRNRRNIDGLLAAGDSPRLQLELEFERRYCRP